MPTSVLQVKGIGPATAEKLAAAGFTSAEDIADASYEQLTAVPGFAESRARQIIANARLRLADVAPMVVEPAVAKKAAGKAITGKSKSDRALKKKKSKKKKTKKEKTQPEKAKKKDKQKKSKKKKK